MDEATYKKWEKEFVSEFRNRPDPDTMLVYRLEDANGLGPFNGQLIPNLFCNHNIADFYHIAHLRHKYSGDVSCIWSLTWPVTRREYFHGWVSLNLLKAFVPNKQDWPYVIDKGFKPYQLHIHRTKVLTCPDGQVLFKRSDIKNKIYIGEEILK